MNLWNLLHCAYFIIHCCAVHHLGSICLLWNDSDKSMGSKWIECKKKKPFNWIAFLTSSGMVIAQQQPFIRAYMPISIGTNANFMLINQRTDVFSDLCGVEGSDLRWCCSEMILFTLKLILMFINWRFVR